MLGILPAPEPPHPSAGASLPILPAIEPRLLDDGPPSSSSAWLPGAPCRGAGRRGLRARRWCWRRCRHLSTQEPEQGQKVGGWAAAPGGRQWCQAGIGVRTSAQGAAPLLFSLFVCIPPSIPPRLPSIAVAVTFTLSLFSGTAATFCHVIPNPAPALAAPKQTRASPQSPPLAAAPQPPPQPWVRDATTSA